MKPGARVSTIIPTYNQEAFIGATIASAVAQLGDFDHEIVISSDGSTDRTRDIVDQWRRRHPGLIRDVGEDSNVGLSGNFRRLLTSATGDYIAILEGDDLWVSPDKLARQFDFLRKNEDCSMVFSQITVRQYPAGTDSFLPRQTGLTKNKLDGADFLAEPTMNLIANMSSCFLGGDIARSLPERMFQGRFNEIALAFHYEQRGKIGFIAEPMSIYHQHSGGVWTGSSREEQLRSGLETRRMVLDVADPKYHREIHAIMEEKYLAPLAQLAQSHEVPS